MDEQPTRRKPGPEPNPDGWAYDQKFTVLLSKAQADWVRAFPGRPSEAFRNAIDQAMQQ